MIPLANIHPYDILIVDDNPMNLGVLSGMLQERGYRVRAATNGRRALEAARLRKPDLIMLDITMPEMDGFQACEILKADPELAAIPVIFISAHDESIDKVRAFNLGGADYVQKPFQIEEVHARIEHQLKITSLQREIQARNDALEEANLKLQELDRLKANFTATIVHDLRNPLGLVQLILEQFQETGKLSADSLKQSHQQIGKALAFLNELLEVFRSEAREITVVRASVDPLALLESAAASFRPQAVKKDIELKTYWGGRFSAIQGDEGKLDRVLSNLLANTLEFTPAQGVVTLWADEVEGEGVDTGTRWLRIAVEDTGRGISAGQIPFVFDPYRQALSGDASHGSGLGLAIVARIVAAHKGRVTVQSQEDVGSCFTVLLPIGS